jgi:hypothetical protein
MSKWKQERERESKEAPVIDMLEYVVKPGCTTIMKGQRYFPGEHVLLTAADAEIQKHRVVLASELKAEKNRMESDARFTR